MPGQMRQVAPFPDALAEVVSNAAYKPGWVFGLADMSRHAGASGLTLTISYPTTNSYRAGEPFSATHYFWVPAESHDAESWRRWLFDQLLLVERHEAMEFFTVNGERPYPPGHGGGHSPYYGMAP
jgi:hypothetical protein